MNKRHTPDSRFEMFTAENAIKICLFSFSLRLELINKIERFKYKAMRLTHIRIVIIERCWCCAFRFGSIDTKPKKQQQQSIYLHRAKTAYQIDFGIKYIEMDSVIERIELHELVI